MDTFLQPVRGAVSGGRGSRRGTYGRVLGLRAGVRGRGRGRGRGGGGESVKLGLGLGWLGLALGLGWLGLGLGLVLG